MHLDPEKLKKDQPKSLEVENLEIHDKKPEISKTLKKG